MLPQYGNRKRRRGSELRLGLQRRGVGYSGLDAVGLESCLVLGDRAGGMLNAQGELSQGAEPRRHDEIQGVA